MFREETKIILKISKEIETKQCLVKVQIWHYKEIPYEE